MTDADRPSPLTRVATAEDRQAALDDAHADLDLMESSLRRAGVDLDPVLADLIRPLKQALLAASAEAAEDARAAAEEAMGDGALEVDG
jgi:hypothetical protein